MDTETQAINGSYLDATGPIHITLRNDMMFHRAMQVSNTALKELVCALKGLDPDEVKEVTLANPIDYSAYAKKEIVLDVKVIMNDNEIIDIELQLYYDKHWEKRSLLYLCRSFDSIGPGDKYSKLKKTTFIAITDRPKKNDPDEFYAHYMLLNAKTHKPYSTLLNLNVLYLKRQELATREDIDNGILYWARLFEASTWEELKELISEKPKMKEVATAMYNSNLIQSQEKTLFEAHQKWLAIQRVREEEYEEAYSDGYSNAKEEDKRVIDDLTSKNSELVNDNKLLTEEISRLNSIIQNNNTAKS